jgi:VanZ family protein
MVGDAPTIGGLYLRTEAQTPVSSSQTDGSARSPEKIPAPRRSTRAAPGRLWVTFRTIAKFVLWGELVVLGALSLVPSDIRPRTDLGSGQMEHALAYFLAGATIAVAHESPRARATIWLLFASGGWIFEFLQNLSPGRAPRAIDALASFGGLTLGVLLGILTLSAARRLR